MNRSDVTAPVKSTVRTVPFGIFIGGGLALLALPILLPLVCNAVLPSVDAERAKTFYLDNFSLALAIVTTGGGLGAVGGSLSGRLGKILAQLAPGMATAATPNGEGVGAMATDATSQVTGAIQSASGDVTSAISDAADEIGDGFEDAAPSLPSVGVPAGYSLNDVAQAFGREMVKALKTEKIQ